MSTDTERLVDLVKEKYPFRLAKAFIVYDPHTFDPKLYVSVDEHVVELKITRDMSYDVMASDILDLIEKKFQLN
jgi:hypothetical protein